MIKHFIVAALRNLLRHKLQTLINIASLATGLTVFAFSFLYVKQETSYDRGWPDGERVHRLTLEQRGFPGLPDRSYFATLARSYDRLMARFGDEFEHASRVYPGPVKLPESEALTSLWHVDADLVEILQPEVLEGDLARAVSGPGFLALEEEYAERAGLQGRIGERLMLEGISGNEIEFELAAIYRLPRPVAPASTIPMLTLMHDRSIPLFFAGQGNAGAPWENQVQAWVKFREGLSTDAFNALQPAYIQQTVVDYAEALGPERRISDHLFYYWQPVRELHFKPLTTEAGNAGASYGDMARVTAFAAVGILVLLVGCSNSISLSLAAALERRREVGVRKAAGALPQDILWQRLGEAVLLALLALIPAIAVLELLLPSFQALLPFVEVDAGPLEYSMLAAIAIVVGLACGLYPALVLSATRPQAVLRSRAAETAKGRVPLRSLLVAVQFFLASILLIGTSALYLQLSVTRSQPLGFDASNVLMLFQNQPGVTLSALRSELAKLPGVVRVIPGSTPPNAGIPPSAVADTIIRNPGDRNEVDVHRQQHDFEHAELVGMRLLAGRAFDVERDNFDPQTGGYQGGVQRVMLNATAVRQLGFASPEEAVEQALYIRRLNNISGEITQIPLQIIGVVEDNLYASLRRRPGPELYSATPRLVARAETSLMLKYDEAVAATIQQRIADEAQRVLGAPLTGIVHAETQIATAFQQEQNESKLLLICGSLALLLASAGLYGLAAFTIENQVKEVGIRKALGAQAASIVTLYLWRFGRPILLACLVAWPVAIYFVLQWIERFPYQLERAWLLPICAGTMAAVLLIAMLAVSVMTTRAAIANPVRSLRYE